jgi:aminopeptidase N
VSPRETTSAQEIYRAPIYTKGAWILHTLRHVMGKEDFLLALRRKCYHHPALEAVRDGRQCRFVTTSDFRLICEEISGQDLTWFFDLYLRQPKLPVLISRVQGDKLSLRWETPDDLPFPMPVEVRLGNELRRVSVDRDGTTLTFRKGIKPEVDPEKWILMAVK